MVLRLYLVVIRRALHKIGTERRAFTFRLWRSGLFFVQSQTRLLDAHAIGFAATEGFWVVHLFGFGRRYDERAGRGRSGDVRVVVNTFPKQRRKCFGAFIA